jgi:hypothetical protein
VAAAARKWGANAVESPPPTFLALLREQALAPFFAFQMFSVGLWMLDEYWQYALFSLSTLVRHLHLQHKLKYEPAATATATTNKTVEPSLIQPTETSSNKFSNTSSWSSLKNATNTDSSINLSSSLCSGGGNSTLKPIDSFQKYKMQLLEKEERVS